MKADTLKSKRANQRLRKIAYHEAGHAVIARVLGCRVVSASIVAEFGVRGGVLREVRTACVQYTSLLSGISKFDYHLPENREKVEGEILVLLAGALAQRKGFPGSRWRVGGGAHKAHKEGIADGSDFQMVSDLIRIVHGDGEVAKKCRRKLEALAGKMVEEHWASIERIAQMLIDLEYVTEREIADAVVIPRRRRRLVAT